MNKKNIIIQLVIVIAIILVANLLSRELYFRLDFTEDNRYTFSKATEEVIDELNGVVTITAYFSEDLPPQLLTTRQDFMDQLVEYENLSEGSIVFEFVNPNESEETERNAQQNGISPVMINVRERDQVQQMRAYLGAVLKMDDRTEIIPVIQPGAAMEYSLTTALKKVSIADKPKLGFIQGYGEPTIQAMPQLMEQLSVLYEVEPFRIKDTASVPSYYKALVWVAPMDTVKQLEFAKIDQYLDQGGGLFLAHEHVQGDLQQGLLSKSGDIGIKSWLAQKGLQFQDQMVIDAQCATVSVQQRNGFMVMTSQKEFPYFPQLNNFPESAITEGIETVMLPFAAPLTFTQSDTSWSQVPLMYSSENSGVVSLPSYVDIQKKWSKADFLAGQQMLAAGLDKGTAKIVAVSNGQFIVNGEGQRPQQLNADNVNFASNSIDWIADDTGLINLRTKGVTSRPLEEVEDSTKTLIKYGNVLAPILLLLIYAFVRKQQSNRRRQKWMQGNYDY
ncbi:GldG family protein [Marinoscillum sp.]|uniref:GldG family protein n=1 Tax=Marinoscillum sp. TaxID=2024838 RepID=UPI003BAD5D47